MIYGNATGGFGMPKSFVLTDNNGNEMTGVVTGEQVVFTAGLSDIRTGKIAANADGIVTGTKDIPAYETSAGSRIIKPGQEFSIPLSERDKYDYTVFQCMISLADSDNLDNSVNTSMVSLKDGVFNVNSDNKLSDVTKNLETKSIDLNITNNTEDSYFIHYFTYREEI